IAAAELDRNAGARRPRPYSKTAEGPTPTAAGSEALVGEIGEVVAPFECTGPRGARAKCSLPARIGRPLRPNRSRRARGSNHAYLVAYKRLARCTFLALCSELHAERSAIAAPREDLKWGNALVEPTGLHLQRLARFLVERRGEHRRLPVAYHNQV